MAQQYRHIVAAIPNGLICNHNLFDVAADDLEAGAKGACGHLNSTLVGLFKTFYGRYTGTEGNLKTEVVDVNCCKCRTRAACRRNWPNDWPTPCERMGKREVGRLVEEQLMDCHTPERARRLAAGPLVLSNELRQPDRRELDDAVLQLLGVSDPTERDELIDRLYEATARHFRDIRVVEIEKMEQRAQVERQTLSRRRPGGGYLGRGRTGRRHAVGRLGRATAGVGFFGDHSGRSAGNTLERRNVLAQYRIFRQNPEESHRLSIARTGGTCCPLGESRRSWAGEAPCRHGPVPETAGSR